MKLTHVKTFSKVAFSFVFSSLLAFGQSEDPLVVFGELTEDSDQVSAFKTGTALVDIPQSVSVFTAEQIKEQGLNSVSDLVDYTPGVVNTQGEGHRDAVVFRGNRSTSSFYVDGVRDDVQYYRSLYNVEQAEVLTGANSLFFGRGNAGGVINRSIKKADFDSDFTNYFGSVNSFGGTELQLDHNESEIDANLAGRLNIHVDQLAGHRDFFYGDRIGINPTVTYNFSDDTSLTLSYEYLNNERAIDRGIPTGADGKPVSALDDVVFGDSELNFSTFDAHVIKATLNHYFANGWTGSATTSYGSYDKLYQNFYTSSYDGALDEVTIDGYRDTTERDRFQLSGDLIGEFATGSIEHKVLLGAEFIHTQNDNDRYNTNFDTTGSDKETFTASNFRLKNGVGVNAAGVTTTNNFNTSVADNTEATITAYSFFIQDEIAINDYVDVVLGGRFDSFKIDVDDLKNNESYSQTDEFFAPRVGLVFKPMENLSIYGSYSQTFAPNSGDQFASISSGARNLDPSEFTNLEVGLKWNIKEDLFLTVAAFELEQSAAEDDGSGGTNFVDSEATGIEVALKGNITDQWSVSAGYTYLENETAAGDTRRESPENSFSIWNNYQVNEKLAFGLGVIYQDDSLTGDGSSSELPSYVRVDAGVTYAYNETFTIALHVENLFDTEYYPSSHSTHQVSVGAPLNATLSVSGSF